MDRDKVDGLTEDFNKALKAAQDYKDAEFKDGAWSSAEAEAKWTAAVDDAFAKRDEAEAGIRRYETETKAAGLVEWAAKNRTVLPGMGRDISGQGDGIVRVQYATMGGEMKSFAPKGNKHFTPADEATYTDIARKALLSGAQSLTPEEIGVVERKTLSMGSDAEGGTLVMSEVQSSELITTLFNTVTMRRLGRVLPPLPQATALSVGTASHLDDATWTQELATGAAETATPFGGRKLSPHPLAKLVRLSNTLRRLAMVDVEAWVLNEISNIFAQVEESAFMTGTGANQPEGVFTTSLATTVTCTSATDIAYNDLQNTIYALKSQYRAGASWIIHRTILKEIMLLVDGIGRPLLMATPNAGMSFDLLGHPVNESEYAPSSSATGLKVAALGNWARSYWIVDTLNTTIQTLTELYAATNETGYIARKETDGMVVDGQGMILLKMA